MMSCDHLYDCLRCGSEVESLEIEVESLEQRIKELEHRLIESRTRIDDLERWVAGIADDHRQIPDWIQQSARSLLAQEGE